jgi:glycosyltransferase involved in cell wall biosynthesis
VRLLHVVPTYVPAWRYGGPINSVHGLCKALARRGHEVTVATTNVDGEGESDVPLDRPVDMDGVQVRYFRAGFPRRVYRSPSMGAYLARAVPSHDAIHLHSVFLWPTTAAARIARRRGVPYFLSPRGMLVRDLVERRSTAAKRAWIALFERRNIEGAAVIHATSGLEAAELEAFGFRLPPVIEIPNGIEIPIEADNAAPSLLCADLPATYVLFVGRINWKKGLETLFEALASATNVRLIIAGNDDEGYRARLDALAARLGIASRIRYLGFVDGPAKDELMRRAAAVVLTSRSENFGNVLLEAMAVGTPVVTTPGVGLADVVASARCGLVVPGDASSIAHALQRMCGDTTLRAELGRNARTVAAERFSWERIAAEFETQYVAAVR